MKIGHDDWLLNLIEELELEINDWRAEVQKWQRFYKESEESHLETKELIKSIVNQNKRYREALEFYADSENWIPQNDDVLSEITMDYGSKARQALEGTKNE